MKLPRALAGICLALGLILPGARGEEASASARDLIHKPIVVYPYSARKDRLSGTGILVVDINSKTGEVIKVRMGQSTGHPILDRAATDAFREARFKKGTASQVRIPIAFAITGVSYDQRMSKNTDEVLTRFLGKGTAIKAPLPQYPTSVPWTFKEGKGLYELHVDKEGKVDEVKILKSSGDVPFDREAVTTLGKWRFRRGPLVLELPLRFTLTPKACSVGIAK